MHPFWLSHKEKWPWLRPSMGRQPWPELELHGRPWGARQRGERGEKGERGGALGEGHGWGELLGTLGQLVHGCYCAAVLQFAETACC
jgi:hypothetical protein